MSVPDFQSLMLPVLRTAAGGDVSSGELRERIAADLHLSADDLVEMLPSGRAPTFANRVAWATFFLQRPDCSIGSVEASIGLRTLVAKYWRNSRTAWTCASWSAIRPMSSGVRGRRAGLASGAQRLLPTLWLPPELRKSRLTLALNP